MGRESGDEGKLDMKIQLCTAAGKEVIPVFDIPPFDIPPRIVIWGERFFAYDSLQPNETVNYREAFTYAIPPGSWD